MTLNLHASILDYQIPGLAQRLKPHLEEAREISLDADAASSAAFVALCVQGMLDVPLADAMRSLTEAACEVPIDAMWVGDVVDQEFVVVLVQGHHHPFVSRPAEESLAAAWIPTVRAVFDPGTRLPPRLAAQVVEVRSRRADGYHPNVRFLWASHRPPQAMPAQQVLEDEAGGWRTSFEHVSHDTLLGLLSSAMSPFGDTLRLVGPFLLEGLAWTRVLVGRVPVGELARWLRTHGPSFLDRALRSSLGLQGSYACEAIRRTLETPAERPHFVLGNEGITMVCDRLGARAGEVWVQDPHVMPGSAASYALWAVLASLPRAWEDDWLEEAHVLVRVVEIPSWSQGWVRQIPYVAPDEGSDSLVTLRSRDARHARLATSIEALGFAYGAPRGPWTLAPLQIDLMEAMQAVQALWRRRPHLVFVRSRSGFEWSYERIFGADLEGAQVVIAVLLFRVARRKGQFPAEGAPALVRHGAAFVAMLMGASLLADLGTDLGGLSSEAFPAARDLVERHAERYYADAVVRLEEALVRLYGTSPLSPTRLAATFRRGDLLEVLGAASSG